VTVTVCVHLASDMRQPLGYIDGVQLCAPCLGDRIEAMLKVQSPDSISRSIAFDTCGHYPAGGFCETCYIGVAGCLSLIWSRLRLHGDTRTANRLLRLLREWSREFGPSSYMGRRKQSEHPKHAMESDVKGPVG
jgi:hypothetical protein